ncbi:MAG: CYTH domain-containing protein [Deltaproteobacteria bacterium]|nr:CYTH domain-containing protein [Deltaproteobacteria bacterium]
MANHHGTEIELKLRVDDLAALMRVCVAAGAAPAFTAVQRNEFLDTAERALDAQRFVLRLRSERSPSMTTSYLTAKGPSQKSADGALSHAPEQEIVVAGEVAEALRAGRADPLQVLEGAADTNDVRRALVARMRAAAGAAPLRLVGGFSTERTRLSVRFPATATAAAFDGVLELDRVHFPGEQVHHEVEFEIPAGVAIEDARAGFDALLARAGVVGRAAPGKASRFFRALKGERLN